VSPELPGSSLDRAFPSASGQWRTGGPGPRLQRRARPRFARGFLALDPHFLPDPAGPVNRVPTVSRQANAARSDLQTGPNGREKKLLNFVHSPGSGIQHTVKP
jgi:hypothetical protein